MVHERGIWLEVVTLVIPGFNDSDEELGQIARFLASVSRDIPWHVTAFHKDYRMTDPEATSAGTLMRAAEMGREAGLRFVYAGNLPGRVGAWENTRCPSCQETLIDRFGYLVRAYRLGSRRPLSTLSDTDSGHLAAWQRHCQNRARIRPRIRAGCRDPGSPGARSANKGLPTAGRIPCSRCGLVGIPC